MHSIKRWSLAPKFHFPELEPDKFLFSFHFHFWFDTMLLHVTMLMLCNMYYVYMIFCLRNALQHVSRKEATKRMTFVEQAVREGGLEGWWKRRPRTPLAEALSVCASVFTKFCCECYWVERLWCQVKALQVKKRAPSVAKAAQKMEEARLHEAIEAGTKQRSNWTWHESHISHESHWHFDNIFNYFDIFYAVSRWKRAFLCDIHWCHWCLAGFMQEVGPVRSQICQIRLSDPFVTKTQAVWVAVDFQVSADEGGGIHP